MVPARNLLRRHCDGYGGGGYDGDIRKKGFCHDNFALSSRLVMAEDNSRSGGGGSDDEEASGGGEGRGDERGEVGTSSKGEERDEAWLRLSIGGTGGGGGGGSGFSSSSRAKLDSLTIDPGRHRRMGELLELDLFRERPPEPRPVISRPPLPATPPATGMISTLAATMMPLLPPQPGPGLLTYRPYPPDMTWSFWSPQASTSKLPPPYNSRQFVYPSTPGSSDSPVEGESSGAAADVRVVSLPSRPHTGVWFVLQASQNQ